MVPPSGGTLAELVYRVTQLELREQKRDSKLDRLTMAIVGMAITMGTSAVIFAVTVLVLRNSE